MLGPISTSKDRKQRGTGAFTLSMTGRIRAPDARVEKMKTAVFVEACQAFRKNGDLNLSASIAFYALLSIIPFLFLTVFLIGHIIAT